MDAANAALDAALTAAGFDPANAEHFTVQVNSSIGVLPNDRYPEDGVTCKLTLPQATKARWHRSTTWCRCALPMAGSASW